MTIEEDCHAAGVSLSTYYFRKKRGLSHEEALAPIKRKKEHSSNPTTLIGQANSKEKHVEIEKSDTFDDQEVIFGLFKSKISGEIKAIYNGEIDRESLLNLLCYLTKECAEITKLIIK